MLSKGVFHALRTHFASTRYFAMVVYRLPGARNHSRQQGQRAKPDGRATEGILAGCQGGGQQTTGQRFYTPMAIDTERWPTDPRRRLPIRRRTQQGNEVR